MTENSARLYWERPEAPGPYFYHLTVTSAHDQSLVLKQNLSVTDRVVGGLRAGQTYHVSVVCYLRTQVRAVYQGTFSTSKSMHRPGRQVSPCLLHSEWHIQPEERQPTFKASLILGTGSLPGFIRQPNGDGIAGAAGSSAVGSDLPALFPRSSPENPQPAAQQLARSASSATINLMVNTEPLALTATGELTRGWPIPGAGDTVVPDVSTSGFQGFWGVAASDGCCPVYSAISQV